MKIVPKPSSITMLDGEFVFSASTEIVGASPLFEKELKEFIKLEDGEKNKCMFVLDTIDEDYRIEIGTNIVLISKDKEGLYHALQTLKQLIFEYKRNAYSYIPCCIIEDEPKYKHRALMIDVVRHFYTIDTIKKIVDAMALIKMNTLHIHLSDDQGFRIQLNKFPNLTEIGSKRAGTRGDNKPVEGYYTQQEMIDLVLYAKQKFINIIPEIDLPGHTTALIASYPELGCTGKEISVSEYFGIKKEILCVGKENTYTVLYSILDELIQIFPYKYFHIGGDEVPKTQWSECEECKKLAKENNFSTYDELQAFFINKIINYLLSKDKTPIVWNEALKGNTLNSNAVVQFWRDGSKCLNVKKALSEGRNVICSNSFAYYLDYPHSLTSLKKTYNYNPMFNNLGEANNNIIGVEAPVWTEWINSTDKLFKHIFPRTLAVAENGWSSSEKDYNDFKNRVKNILDIFDYMAVPYTPIRSSNPNMFVKVFSSLHFYLNLIDKNSSETVKNYKNINMKIE